MAEGGSTHQKGCDGEELAVAFLLERGYRVLQRNVRLPGGEIDVVCVDRGVLVFVEGKRRDGIAFGSAFAAVDSRKRARLRSLAADYAQVVAPQAKYRFDVVAVDGNRLALHRNAF